MSSQSSTVRANTPVVSRTWEIGATPPRGQRPVVGLKPTTPHNDAGTRIEPIVSPPKAAGTMPAATAAADPLEDPPLTRLGARGFFTWPYGLLSPVNPKDISTRLFFPNTI